MAEENGTNKIITIFLAIIITLAVITILYVSLPEENTKDTGTGDENQENQNGENEEEIILTVNYNDEKTDYTLTDLESLETLTGMGGYRTSYPAIKGQATYTGVPIKTLVEQSAGQIRDYNITVTSDEDGEIDSKNYTYEMVQGDLDIYNATNASDETPIGFGDVTMIVCYKIDGEYLDESKDGKLKIAFVNEDEELITTAGLWWKYVVSIEIIEE